MTLSLIICWLYVIGLFGLNAAGRDLERRSSYFPRTIRTRLNLLFWPFTIFVALLGDIYDYLSGKEMT